MKVLVACESSGTVRRAFRALGHDAWSCDILPADDDGANHIVDDAESVVTFGWDLIIAHPPCTRLTNSGVSWLARRNLWDDMREGARFFNAMLNAPCERIAVENPIQHKYARELIRKYDQIIHPWMFGHAESKSTCLWLKGLPKLRETHNVKAEMLALPDKERQRLHYLPPSPDRWKLRSKTYDGIAQAMASQWG